MVNSKVSANSIRGSILLNQQNISRNSGGRHKDSIGSEAHFNQLSTNQVTNNHYNGARG